MQTLQNKYLFFWSRSLRGSNVTKACLSQWCPSYMIIDNVPYCNVEQYLLAEKPSTFVDTETEQNILKTSDPQEIKILGREVKNYDDEVWGNLKKPYHKFCHYYKADGSSQLNRPGDDTSFAS